MNPFFERFPDGKTILPVIHVFDFKQARRNANLAKLAGVDGVFLISHAAMNGESLAALAKEIRSKVGIWAGVNCLGLSNEKALVVAEGLDGVWVDNAEIFEEEDEQPVAEALNAFRTPYVLYFGGVAFKYQRAIGDVESAVRKAKPYMDVITTSGAATGAPPNLKKIQIMHQAAEGHPLAIASGITVENIGAYLPYVDAFLVATGISRDFHNLDLDKTRRLCRRQSHIEVLRI